MTTYEIHYFNATARADLSRLLLDFAGASYKNVFVKGVEWGTKQDTTPFGKIPMLVIKDADGSTKVRILQLYSFEVLAVTRIVL